MSEYSNCKGCGRVIEWNVTQKGGKIPLERLRSFRVDPDGVARPGGEVLVSHFLTCPKAADFSGRNKSPGPRSA